MSSNFSASIPVANMQAANTTLQNAGYGPNNFSVPAYGGPTPTVPAAMTKAAATANGATS